MIIVFGTHGAPGATSTCIYTATMWTARGRPIALLDADPVGGTLLHHLGLLQDPGVASLITRRNIHAEDILNCSQNVLVENLRVLPLPDSPGGAGLCVDRLIQKGQDLANVSSRLPLIIDAGRVYPNHPVAKLVPYARAVLVVIQSAHRPGLAMLRDFLEMLGIDDNSLEEKSTFNPSETARIRKLKEDSIGVVTVGPQFFSDRDFHTYAKLPVVCNFPYDPTSAYTFSDVVRGNTRNTKKFQLNLKQPAEELWDFSFKHTAKVRDIEDMVIDDPFAIDMDAMESMIAAT